MTFQEPPIFVFAFVVEVIFAVENNVVSSVWKQTFLLPKPLVLSLSLPLQLMVLMNKVVFTKGFNRKRAVANIPATRRCNLLLVARDRNTFDFSIVFIDTCVAMYLWDISCLFPFGSIGTSMVAAASIGSAGSGHGNGVIYIPQSHLSIQTSRNKTQLSAFFVHDDGVDRFWIKFFCKVDQMFSGYNFISLVAYSIQMYIAIQTSRRHQHTTTQM
mmetsp:Transcript_2422/g.5106  ORF Transcript_2422/g.5106 Transcript_2422/m.5106 type:complete len:215 (-) Transcript_2422:1152-1796(-)